MARTSGDGLWAAADPIVASAGLAPDRSVSEELGRTGVRPNCMRTNAQPLKVVAVLLLAGCAHGSSERADTGVSGVVHVGPQCPVEAVGRPCPDRLSDHVRVTVSQASGAQTTGKLVAQGRTDTDGGFRIPLAPGEYLVTADAGMSCQSTATRVVAGRYVSLDIRCDSGIR
jgi:hypothetical protein